MKFLGWIQLNAAGGSDAGVLHDSHDRSEGVRGRENTVKKL